ncbi:MAG: hypothetical protein ABL921_29655 [Pirellula sp.]
MPGIADVEFDAVPISEVAKFFEQAVHVPFVVDALALEDESISQKEPITIKRQSTRVRDCLAMILDPLQLTYEIHNETVVITSLDSCRGVIRYYDLSYIVSDNGLTTEIIDLIETMVVPDMWQNAGGTYSIKNIGSMLVVSADERSNLQIESLLRSISKQSPANLKSRVVIDDQASKPKESDPIGEKK